MSMVIEVEDNVVPQEVDNQFSLNDIQEIGDYLNMFGVDLIRRLNTEYEPVHHPSHDDILECLAELKRPLFNAQAHVTTALFKGYLKHRRLVLVGEMGTGKTAISISLFYSLLKNLMSGKGRVIYMVPNHLVKKTKREIGKILQDDWVEVHFIDSYKDVIQLRDSGKMNKKAEKMEVYIIARDTAKLGYLYELVPKWSSLKQGWICPDCGQVIMKKNDDDLAPMEYDDFYNKHGKETRRKSNLKCNNRVRQYLDRDPEKDTYKECGAHLWQAKNKDKSSFSGMARQSGGHAPRRVSPSELFKKYFKRKFDVAIGDECHELTGGSAQAHAFHVLMGCAKYTLAMTGTLMNGYASNLYELFYRMFPSRLKEMGFEWGDVGKWIDLYGVRERVTKIKESDDLNASSNGSKKKSVKEMPAAAPQLFTDFLSDVACFIQMADMFEVLPDLKEGPMNILMEGKRKFISCTTRLERKPGAVKRKLSKRMRLMAPAWYLARNFHQVERLLKRAIDKELQSGGKSVLLGSLVSTLLSYPDVPFNFNGVYHPDTGACIVPPTYRLSERLLYPKELQLIRFIKSQIKVGRKVGVYATFTGKMGTLERLQQLLEEQGIRAAILESDVPGKQREAWITERENEGIQVLLTNPILVSTGLDLLGFPSLYFYQTGYRLSVVRQASRRHWRIGQSAKCVTIYSAYKDTMQELAINLMASKMNAALALEGQFSTEGLAALTEGSGGSLASELAKRFVGNKIQGVESAESIWGKMSLDASQFISNEPTISIGGESTSEKVSRTIDVYRGDNIRDVLLMFVDDHVPQDLVERFQQQIDYVVQNVESGWPGIVLTQPSLLSYEIQINNAEIPAKSEDFRKWLFNLTVKPFIPEAHSNKQRTSLELIVGSTLAKGKSKKSYKVSDGQLAFNF